MEQKGGFTVKKISPSFIINKISEFANKRKSKFGKVLTFIGFAVGALILAGAFSMTMFIIIISFDLPNVKELKEGYFNESTTIYDREGNVLYTVFSGESGENRDYVPLSEISKYAALATVAIEDRDFYEHAGFDLGGIIKGLIHEFIGIGVSRGGSTITQQLMKNVFLNSERSLSRKGKEFILAMRVEQNFTKDEILEMYLNKISYGNNSSGIEKAAETYFNKKAKDLTLAESAILAAIPNAPTYYSPYGQHIRTTLAVEFTLEEVKSRNIESANDIKNEEYSWGLLGNTVLLPDGTNIYLKGRVDTILNNMLEEGMITQEEKQKAWEDTQKEEIFTAYKEKISNPHFVLYVKQLLEDEYGKELVEGGGLKVYTTLDPRLQDMAEEAITKDAEKNASKYNANDASLVAMDPKTGHILAMVGSADYFNDEIDGKVNMAISPKQPGSSFKPIVYSQMFKTKYGPGTIIYDVMTPFGGDYPKNFDGSFMGPISLKKALGKSRNIPAIKAYYLAGGQKEIIKTALSYGITSLNPETDYGWPLGLGSGEVKLLEMVEAYSVFANSGKHHKSVSILKVEDSKGRILFEWNKDENKGEDVLNPQVAYIMSDILSDTSMNVGSNLNIPGHKVAAKTGTSTKELSNGNILPSNLWTIGFSTQVAAGVWVGNASDKKNGNLTYSADGYNAAAPIWKNFMVQAHSNKSYENFPMPEGIQRVQIDSATGLLPSENTPQENIISDIFPSFSVPKEKSDAYQEYRVNTLTNMLWQEGCPEEYVENKVYKVYHDIDPTNEIWENAVQAWVKSMAAKEENALSFPPVELCKIITEDQKPIINIMSPKNGELIELGGIPIKVSIYAPLGVYKVEYYLDDILQYTRTSEPFTSGNLRLTETVKEDHLVLVKLYDKEGYKSEAVTAIKMDMGKEEEPQEEEGADNEDTDKKKEEPVNEKDDIITTKKE